MANGHFYFLDDQYYTDFPDPQLMRNKENVNGLVHDRPCFCAFQDNATGLYWMIPISSQVQKFRAVYQQKVQKYGFCDTIAFGKVWAMRKRSSFRICVLWRVSTSRMST